MTIRRAHLCALVAVVAATLALALVAAPQARAAATPTPTSLAFTAQVGTTSAPQTVTLTNGASPLLISGTAVVDPNAARFSIVSNNCVGPLLAGQSCSVAVTYTPAAAGEAASANLVFSFLGTGPVTPVRVGLSGTGTTAPPPPPPAPEPPAPAQPVLDADDDGVPTPADLCPSQPGIPPDGCPDRDGDGVPDRADACPSAPGDLANGCPRELNADVAGRWRMNARFTKMLSLVVRARVDSRIDVRCQGRRDVCRFSTRTIRATKKRTTSLTRLFGRTRVLPAGTTITVRVTQRGLLGTYERLRTRTERRLPSVKQRCIDHRGKMIRCP